MKTTDNYMGYFRDDEAHETNISEKHGSAKYLSSKNLTLTVLTVLLGGMLPVLASFVSHNRLSVNNRAAGETFLPAEVLVETNILKDVFNRGTNNAFATDPVYFGSYVVQPVGGDLYVGLSAGLPADKDGALLAKYSGSALSPVINSSGSGVLYEQGIHDIAYDGTTLYIPGTDPMDDWTKGNFYTMKIGEDMVKHRSSENVLHGLGVLVEGSTIYMGTGAHTGDNATWVGRLYKSTDGGESWTYPKPAEGEVEKPFSDYRLWDVVRFKGDMYGSGLLGDGYTPVFKKSTDNGQTWQDIYRNNYDAYPRTRIVEFNGQLVNRENGTTKDMWVFDGTNERWVTLPGGYYTFGAYAMNAMAVDRRGYFYTLARRSLSPGGSYGASFVHLILRTNDLNNWQIVSELPAEPFSLTYWSDKDQLVIGTGGDNAKLYKVQLADNLTLPPVVAIPTLTPSPIPPSPTPTWYPPAPVTPIVSKDGKIMYGGNGPLSIANPDGSNQQVFVKNWETGDYFVSGASWSVDGKTMALVARRYTSSDYSYNYRIFTKSYPEGVYEEWLPPQAKNIAITHPHLSPDGNVLYFSMNAGQQDFYGLYKVRKGQKQAEVIIPAPSRGKYLLGDVSPDGTKLVYYFGGDGYNPDSEDIFIINTDGSGKVNLTNTSGTQNLYPTFSPDGKKVMYYRFNSNSTYDLMTLDISTLASTFIRPTADVDESYGCFSPSGTEIVYGGRTKTTPYVDSIYRAGSDGSNAVRVISPISNAWLQMHCWAPDPLAAPTPVPVVITPSSTNIEDTIVKNYSDPTGLSFGSGFSITANGTTTWQLYNNQDGTYTPVGGQPTPLVVQGFGFYESSGGITAGQTVKIRSYTNNNRAAGVYKGSYYLQSVSNGVSTNVAKIYYSITVAEPVTKPVINTTTLRSFKAQTESASYFVVTDDDGDNITASVTVLPKKLVFTGCNRTSEKVFACYISGKALVAGNYPITITARDTHGNTVSQQATLSVVR